MFSSAVRNKELGFWRRAKGRAKFVNYSSLRVDEIIKREQGRKRTTKIGIWEENYRKQGEGGGDHSHG